jgi:hypothetical protein
MPKLNAVDNARLSDDRTIFDDFDNEYIDDYDVNDDEDKNEEIKNQVKEKVFNLINHLRSKNQLSAVLLNEIIKVFGDLIFDF